MITSTKNQQLKLIKKLLGSKKAREETGLFIVEGERSVSEIPEELVEKIYVSETYFRNHEEVEHEINVKGYSKTAFDRTDIEIAADEIFRSVSDTKNPQGIMAVARQPKTDIKDILKIFEQSEPGSGYTDHISKTANSRTRDSHSKAGDSNSKANDSNIRINGSNSRTKDSYGQDPDLIKNEKKKLLILDDVRDPGNIGTMIRTAEACGAAGVILSPGCADIYNPKVTRSTMGSIFRVPIVTCGLKETIEELIKLGVEVYGSSLDSALDYRKISYGSKIAFVIGNEANGISKEILSITTENVKIPMKGKVESLNAAISAAVLMFNLSG